MECENAGKVMIPLDEYPWVAPGCSLREAIALIESPRFDIVSRSGRLSIPRVLLVIDEEKGIVGMLRRRDIFRGLEPRFLQSAPSDSRTRLFSVEADPNLSELSPDAMVKAMMSRAGRPARDVMIPIQATVGHDDHLAKVIEVMVDRNVSLVPVLEGGKVVGVVRSVDVFHEVARCVLQGMRQL